MDKDEDEGKPDPLTQLVTTFCRGAMTERSGALQEDPLYMSYARIISKSCGEEEEEGEDEGGGGEEEGGASIHVSVHDILTKNLKLLLRKLLKLSIDSIDVILFNNFVCFSRVLTPCRSGAISHLW